MSVIKFLLGEKGREIRTDLGKGWSNYFDFLIIEVGSFRVSGEISLLVLVEALVHHGVALPHVTFREEIQREEHSARPGKRKG